MNPSTTSGGTAGVRPPLHAPMRRRPSIIWLGPLACLGALGFMSFRALDARRASAADVRPAAVVAESEQQVKAVPRSAPRFAPTAEAAPANTPPSSDDVAPPASWRTYQAKLQGEAPDPRWSAPTTAQIKKVVAELALPGTTLVSARCGQTVCEAVFDHANHEDQLNAPMALTKGPFATGVHYRYEGLRTYAYLQRE
jgi:hypothetical protein